MLLHAFRLNMLQLLITKYKNAECKFTATFLTKFQCRNSKNWLHTSIYYEIIVFLN